MIGDNWCGGSQYEKHEFEPWVDKEERAVLVMTHGQRAGRAYNVDRLWRERICSKCGVIERTEQQQDGLEWPR